MRVGLPSDLTKSPLSGRHEFPIASSLGHQDTDFYNFCYSGRYAVDSYLPYISFIANI